MMSVHCPGDDQHSPCRFSCCHTPVTFLVKTLRSWAFAKSSIPEIRGLCSSITSHTQPHDTHAPTVDHQHSADTTAMLRTAAKALLESGSLTHTPLQPYCIAPVLQVRFVKREHCGQQHQCTVGCAVPAVAK
jgi:hypothetical protein